MKFSSKVAVVYFIFGLLWISISDYLFISNIHEQFSTPYFQVYKGIVFVIISVFLIYNLINYYNKKVLGKNIQILSERNFLDSILSSLSSNIAVLDSKGEIIRTNLAWDNFGRENSYNQPINTGVGVNYIKVCERSCADGDLLAGEVAHEINSIINGKKELYVKEYPCHSPDIYRWFVLRVVPLTGLIRGAVVVHENVTHRKIAEIQLTKSEQKYKAVFENSSVPIWITDSKSKKFIDVNQAAIIKYGYTFEEFLNISVNDINIMESKKSGYESRFENGHSEMTIKQLTKSGNVLYVNLLSTSVEINDCICELISIIDLTNEIDTEKHITNSIIKAVEEERYTIAREIHDNLTQILSIASLNFKNLKYDFDSIENQPKYEKGLKYIDEAIDQSRSLSHQIMPSTISDFGLIPSIKELIEDHKDLYNININFQYEGPNILEYSKSLNIYRIVQEALNNVIKHANASEVKIDLKTAGGYIILIIEDNGTGFSQQEGLSYKNGIGLRTIRSRSVQLNGILTIKSKAGQGTSIFLNVPNKENE